MNGNFTFHNPTKLHFGEKLCDALAKAFSAGKGGI